MRTDYTATFYRLAETLEVSDGHDNVVVEIPCASRRLAPVLMAEYFGRLALYIKIEAEA